ncbi:MAG: DUF1566 domain-containing protein [Deltaproteobacteria bacterium]|nr:DUF1566 domain-containing protein [Deltaproteobacteria bacterium]
MCTKQVYRRLLITLLFLAFLSTTSYLFAASRGIQVFSKKGQSLYLYKDYHAVVIGVSDYDHWPTLSNAVKDAQEVFEALKLLGFEVNLVTNPTYQQLRKVLNDLTYKYGREHNRALLFYYAGHGETEIMADGTRLGYIIPRDCPLLHEDPQGFVNRAISMKAIEAYSLRIRSKHLLMLFDSCFSGSLFSMVRAVPEDISEKSSQPVRQYITAGTEEEQVPDQSLFKRSLLVGLKGDADLTGDGYITGSELGMYLSSKVVKYTKGKQHPQYGKINNPELDRGDFVFVPIKVRQKEIEEDKKRQKERGRVAEKRESLKQEEARLLKEKKLYEEQMRKLEIERKQFEEKRQKFARLESEKSVEHQNLLKAESELQEEKKRIQGERERLEKEKQKLAYIPKTVKSARVPLRAEPQERLTTDYIRYMVKRYNFFENNWNISGSFDNDFLDNGDGTVTDRTTGLIWQKSGSSRSKTWRKAELYIDKLNRNQFAGYSDWRLPTIDELASIIEKKDMGGLHLDPLFDKKQTHCWSADNGPELTYGSLGLFATWIVNFAEGRVKQAQWATGDLARYNNLESNYIKAVRSLESQ